MTGSGYVFTTLNGFDGPNGVAWSQATSHIYVTNTANGMVYALWYESIAKKYSTAADSEPAGAAYDEYNDKMYVAGYGNNEVYVLT